MHSKVRGGRIVSATVGEIDPGSKSILNVSVLRQTYSENRHREIFRKQANLTNTFPETVSFRRARMKRIGVYIYLYMAISMPT